MTDVGGRFLVSKRSPKRQRTAAYFSIPVLLQRMTDLYGLLGLSPSVSLGPADIRSAYRRSALQAHPDKGGSEEKFHAVLTAFEVLSCRTSRESYDSARSRGLSAADALAIATGRAPDPATKRKSNSAPLERLRQLLAKMGREQRQEALQKLPREVRDALVSYMEGAASSKESAPASNATSRNAAKALENGEEQTGTGTRGIGRGILRQATSPPTYKASIFLPSLFVMSRPNPSLERVLQLHSALVRTRELVFDGEDFTSARFRQAFSEACREAELDADKELQNLTFTAIIPAYYEVNRQIKGRQTPDLNAAFALREQLLEAKAEGWPALRDVWIAIMQTAPEATGHRACSAEEAARIADAAWEAGIPARAKTEARRQLKAPKRKSVEDSAEVTLEEAAAAVSRALKAEAAAKRPRKARPTSQKTRSLFDLFLEQGQIGSSKR
eukprot:s2729_g11.t1